jgi:hypothetical protein
LVISIEPSIYREGFASRVENAMGGDQGRRTAADQGTEGNPRARLNREGTGSNDGRRTRRKRSAARFADVSRCRLLGRRHNPRAHRARGTIVIFLLFVLVLPIAVMAEMSLYQRGQAGTIVKVNVARQLRDIPERARLTSRCWAIRR